jgi:hypothetical protein
MTPNEQRIVLAVALGGWVIDGRYTDVTNESGPMLRKVSDKPPIEFAHPNFLPDYLTDLNAVHELEAKLSTTHEEHEVVYFTPEVWRQYVHEVYTKYGICATAAQRCEALLRTLGLWKESV